MTDTTDTTAGRARGDLGPPHINADEKTTLVLFLDYLRDRVAAKLDGLADHEAVTPGVPSGTSIGGLVKHMTGVELNWFVWAYEGADVPTWDHNAPATEDDTAEALIEAYRVAVERANAVVAACDDLDRPGVRSLRDNVTAPSMRWILVHMIEETARHAGHADILREQIDGAVGR